MGVWIDMERNNRIRMVIQAAKEIKDNNVVLVGVGLPNLAANFAKKLYSPRLILVYESGSIDCSPDRQPLSIGDPSLSENVSALFPIFEIFSYIIIGERIDVGYLGAAQIDSRGDLNTTVIGEYENPKVRLPGSGGACEILYYAKKSVIMVELTETKFKKKVDFITSSRQSSSDKGAYLAQEEVIITDKCIIRLKAGDRSEITAVYKETDLSVLRILSEKLGIEFPANVRVLDDPTKEEMQILESMDPAGAYLGR